VKRPTWTSVCSAVTVIGAASAIAVAQNAPKAAKPPATTPPSASSARRAQPAPVSAHAAPAADHNAIVKRYCVTCHNDTRKTGGLTLSTFDVARAADNAEVAERMIRKLQAGMMPPPGASRPDPAAHTALVAALETTIDAAAAGKPNPGTRPFQRLNRPEYARAIRDLLALDVDAGNWLPLDTKSANFDNIADAQSLSPTLLESYLNAAAAISRMAVGDRQVTAVDATYTAAGYVSQHPWDHVEGAPYGTRGGMVVNHVFPADAEYVFEVDLTSGSNARFEDIDISIDGERVALIEYETGPAGGADGRGAVPMRPEPVLV
jgi:cytochrome c551/c552